MTGDISIAGSRRRTFLLDLPDVASNAWRRPTGGPSRQRSTTGRILAHDDHVGDLPLEDAFAHLARPVMPAAATKAAPDPTGPIFKLLTSDRKCSGQPEGAGPSIVGGTRRLHPLNPINLYPDVMPPAGPGSSGVTVGACAMSDR